MARATISIEGDLKNSLAYINKLDRVTKDALKRSMSQVAREGKPKAARMATLFYKAKPNQLTKGIKRIKRIRGPIEAWHVGVELLRKGINMKHFLTSRPRIPRPHLKGRSPGGSVNSPLPPRKPIEVEVTPGRRVQLRKGFVQRSTKGSGGSKKIAVFMRNPKSKSRPQHWIPLYSNSLAKLIHSKNYLKVFQSWQRRRFNQEFERIYKLLNNKAASVSKMRR